MNKWSSSVYLPIFSLEFQINYNPCDSPFEESLLEIVILPPFEVNKQHCGQAYTSTRKV